MPAQSINTEEKPIVHVEDQNMQEVDDKGIDVPTITLQDSCTQTDIKEFVHMGTKPMTPPKP